MDKKLLAHDKFVRAEIEKFENELKTTGTNQDSESVQKRINKLYRYHCQVVRDFQHERLIHLIVTLFFACLLLLSVASLFLVAYSYTLLNILILIIAAILLVTELFYIRHYYQLENGTQKLYDLSEKLYKLNTPNH
ncbi:MAG: hypothetical protein WCJ36_00500 [Candidatus Saccharibacteria bacterium]